MTLHINTEVDECEKCEALYVAYEKGYPCPNCGELETSLGENYNFIDLLARSLRANILAGNSFIPNAWSVSCTMDTLQMFYFKVFEERRVGNMGEYVTHLIKLDTNPDLNISYKIRFKAIILTKVTEKYIELFGEEDLYLNKLNKNA